MTKAEDTGLRLGRGECTCDVMVVAIGWGSVFGFGADMRSCSVTTALWVAPVLDEGARSRDVALPHGDWIATWSGKQVRGGGEVLAPAPRDTIPVWVRSGSIVVTYPQTHLSAGLGDTPEHERPLEATLWGRPRLGSAAAWLADGTKIAWRAGRWSVDRQRAVRFSEC